MPPGAGASPSAAPADVWVTGGSVAPGWMQAYYATRSTPAGLAPVACQADAGLACLAVSARMVADLESTTPALPQIPGPDALWPQLAPAHLGRPGATVHVILIDDLSPALSSHADVQVALPGPDLAARPQVTSVSVNGAVVAMDLGNLAVGRYVVLIRQVFSLPPDPHGLVETWKALAIEVF